MDNRTIFSKTGKGSLEITKKTIKLASDERQTLILVDGKSSVGDIEEKLSRVQPVRLRAIIDKLVELDLIREFVTSQGPASIMPTPGSAAAAMKVTEISDEDELDFTALAPVASGNTIKEVEERRLAALRAEEEAQKQRAEDQRRAAQEAEKRAAEDAVRRQAEEAAARAKAEEDAKRKAHEDSLRRIEEEARRKVEEEYRVKAEEEAKRRAEEEARRRAEEEARRKVEEEARRKAEEEARRKAEEEARRKAEEEARRKAEEEARRKAAEEARRKAEEEARRKAEEEARRKAEEESRRKAEEELRRKAEEEARRKAEEEARRKAEEDARRKAEEEARRKAEEELRRKAEEEARRKAEEEEAHRKAEQETRLRAEAEARYRAETEARLRAEADARLRAEEEQRAAAERAAVEHRQREEAERRQRAEAEAQLREQTERRAREETEARERARREEEAKRATIAEQQRAAAEAAAAARQAEEEAARYTAALTPHLEQAAPAPGEPLDLDFAAGAENPAPVEEITARPVGGMGAFSDTGGAPSIFDTNGNSSILEAQAGDEVASRKSASRKELEREAKEAAKAAARAKKEAERQAKLQAKESKVKIRRGGGFGIGKIIALLVVLAILGGVGYLYVMPVDKAAVERLASARAGEPVKVASAKFDPFPPQLTLTNVSIGDLVLPKVVAVPDTGSLTSSHKIWKSIDIGSLSLDMNQAKKLLTLMTQEPPRAPGTIPEMTIQRVRALNVSLSGAPVAVPVFNATVVYASGGGIKEATVALADGKAQVMLAPDEKGWTVDFESHGVALPLGPKTPWEMIRAKGLANAGGVKFDSFAVTHFAGTATGAGELTWGSGWKYSGNFDIGGMETEAIGTLLYGASPVSGTMDGKFTVGLSGPNLAQLFNTVQFDGDTLVNKPAVKNLDLARTAQTGTSTAGTTRFSDFSATIGVAPGNKLQIKNVKGLSGLLTITGGVDVAPNGNLDGTLNVEIGVGSNRTKAAIKVGGTAAEPKLSTK